MVRYLLFIFWIIVTPVNAQEDTNSYANWINYKIVSEVPVNPKRQFIVVSTSYFDTISYCILNRSVYPDRRLFYFVASEIGDSIYLTPFSNLASAMKIISGGRDFLVFVNGHGKNFARNLGRGLLLDERYNLNVILFEWPTYYHALTGTIINAKKVAPSFNRFIKDFNLVKNEFYPTSNASVIFHSMGNRIAHNLVKLKETERSNVRVFNNLILNAAAVPQWRHSHWVNKLQIQDRIYIISNQGDYPLHGVWFLRKSIPLGMSVRSPYAKNAFYIDFSLVAGEAHNYYTGRSDLEKNNHHVFEFYNSIFHGEKPDLSDKLIFRPKEKGQGFYIY